jgi:hypothetical protein
MSHQVNTKPTWLDKWGFKRDGSEPDTGAGALVKPSLDPPPPDPEVLMPRDIAERVLAAIEDGLDVRDL